MRCVRAASNMASEYAHLSTATLLRCDDFRRLKDALAMYRKPEDNISLRCAHRSRSQPGGAITECCVRVPGWPVCGRTCDRLIGSIAPVRYHTLVRQ